MISHEYLSFRLGLSWNDKKTGWPGSEHAFIEPEFAQCAVTTWPVSSFTSTIKRLYLLISVPRVSFGQCSTGFPSGFFVDLFAIITLKHKIKK